MEQTVEIGAMGTAAVVAAFLIPVVSLLKRPTWTTKQKYAVGMLAALVSALVGMAADGDITDVQSLVASFGAALATSQTLYNMYFRETDANVYLENSGNK